MSAALPAPEITPVTAPYWRSLENGRLSFQHCRACGHAWLPPRSECPSCLKANFDWREASGKGRLVSWVVYRVAYHEALRDRLPYTVAVVELDEGPGLITRLPDHPDGHGLTMDAPVELAPSQQDGATIATFRLTDPTDTT